jgi:hypothetical protein
MSSRRRVSGLLVSLLSVAALLVAAAIAPAPRSLVHHLSYSAETFEASDLGDAAGSLDPCLAAVTPPGDPGTGSLLQLRLHRSERNPIPVRHLKLGSPPDDPFLSL